MNRLNFIKFDHISLNNQQFLKDSSNIYPIDYVCNNLKFIHIGKCGGTTMNYKFINLRIMVKEYHLAQPPIKSENFYFFWIRNPFSRFISAFNHSKAILDFDVDLSGRTKYNLENSPAPAKINNIITHGFAFDTEYDCLISEFSSANELAESLSSNIFKQREKATKLMTSHHEHIFKGIGWYLYNGEFIKKNIDKIIFVGCLENYEDDFNKLCEIITLPYKTSNNISNKRVNNSIYSKYLSKLSINNLKNFYLNSDFKALKAMLKHKLINNEIFDSYHYYDE